MCVCVSPSNGSHDVSLITGSMFRTRSSTIQYSKLQYVGASQSQTKRKPRARIFFLFFLGCLNELPSAKQFCDIGGGEGERGETFDSREIKGRVTYVVTYILKQIHIRIWALRLQSEKLKDWRLPQGSKMFLIF